MGQSPLASIVASFKLDSPPVAFSEHPLSALRQRYHDIAFSMPPKPMPPYVHTLTTPTLVPPRPPTTVLPLELT